MRLKLPDGPNEEISAETLVKAGSASITLSRDGKFLLVHASDTVDTHNFRYERLFLFDLVGGTSGQITSHGDRLAHAAGNRALRSHSRHWRQRWHRPGRTHHRGGTPPADRSRGNDHQHRDLTGRRWIASADDESVRLWPMPDATKPPLHTLPHDKLLAKLDTFTNLRAVRDEASPTGWSLEIGPFPGWETVPEW